jgi:hypothetical protein
MRHDQLSPAAIQRLKSRAYQRYYLRPAWAGKFLTHQWRRMQLRRSEATGAPPMAASDALSIGTESLARSAGATAEAAPDS